MNPKKFKPKKPETAVQARKNAMRRLRERWEKENEDEAWEPEKEPIVSPMFRAVEGGIPHVIEALRAHDEDDSRSFLETYDEANAVDRRHLSLESISFAAGIGSLRLAEIAQTALYLYGSMKTKMLISSSMAKVTKSIVKAATDHVPITAMDWETGTNKVVGHTNGDVKAMDLFGRMSGIVPVPKGAQIAIQNNFGDKEIDEPARTAPAWKHQEDRLKEIYDAIEPKRLPSPETRPAPLGGHIDRLQDETIDIVRGQ